MMDELEIIRNIRLKNNDLWMSILEIALRNAPDKTKVVLAQIRINDALITEQITSIIGDIYEN